jgi:putative DNA primase/helicase
VRDPSHGFWRRIHLIPFEVTFSGANKNMNLKDQLKVEAPGILAWAVRGCLAWQRVGLLPTDKVKAATEEYKNESNQLNQWIEDNCEAGGKLQAKLAYENYQRWCGSRKQKNDYNQTTFGKEMKSRYRAEGSRQVFYLGLSLKAGPIMI